MNIRQMTTADEILSLLAVRARSFEFPAISSASFAVISARLRGFTHGAEWALIFEWMGFSELELSFPHDLYCYGSVFPNGFALRQVDGIEIDPETWAADCSWQPVLPISLRVGGRIACASRDRDAKCEVLLEESDLENEVVFGHAVVRNLGYPIVLNQAEFLIACPEVADLRECYSHSDWDHPDISRGESVEQSVALRRCAEAICGEVATANRKPAFDSLRSRALARRSIQ